MSSKKQILLHYLEKPRAICTFLCLLEGENKGLDEILKEIGGSKSTGMARIKELIKIGFVTKKASQSESRKMFYCLEKKGKIVANILKSLLEGVDE